MSGPPVFSSSLSAQYADDLAAWGIDLFTSHAEMLLRAANQDGFLALSVKPTNELQELEWLKQREATNRFVLAAPIDPAHTAERMQAQLELQRQYALTLKFQGATVYDKKTAGAP